MKRAEYDSIIKKMSNPDTLNEGLIELEDKLNKDQEEFDKISKSNEELKLTNSKLYLRISNVVKDKPTEEDLQKKEDEELESKFLAMFKEG